MPGLSRLLVPLLSATTLLTGCWIGKREYLAERDRRVATQRRARELAREERRLRSRVGGLTQRLRRSSGHRELKGLERQRSELAAQTKMARRALRQCRDDALVAKRPEPRVQLSELRFWKKAHQRHEPLVRKHTKSRLSALERCYKLHGWDLQGRKPLRGDLWVLFGLMRGRPRGARVVSASFPAGGTLGAKRAAKLQVCIRKVFEHLPVDDMSPHGRQLSRLALRVSQRVVMAESRRAAARVKASPFQWPWRRPKGPATKGEVCGPGELSQLRFAPSFRRRCASGLRCCYPCGTRGCDSICQPRCRKNLP